MTVSAVDKKIINENNMNKLKNVLIVLYNVQRYEEKFTSKKLDFLYNLSFVLSFIFTDKWHLFIYLGNLRENLFSQNG